MCRTQERVRVTKNTFVRDPKRIALLGELQVNWVITVKWILD
jgi:hypothetical protein